MRNVVPLTTLGCVAVLILGVIAGGAIMLGYGINEYFSKKPADSTKQKEKEKDGPRGDEPGPGPPQVPATHSLTEARRSFRTNLIDRGDFVSSNEVPKPVPGADVVFYNSGKWPLAAYLSSAERPKRVGRPAVVWVHDGHGDVRPEHWQQARRFHDADFVLMVPSFRGENANPGRFEMFYGEVDDLLAAVEFLTSHPEVDPGRIYVAGTGDGGTLALLAATTGTPKVRAFFAINGIPQLERYLAEGHTLKNPGPPFDPGEPQEARLRSAAPFAGAIRRPTIYFGLRPDDPRSVQAKAVESAVRKSGARFEVHTFRNATENTLAAPVIDFIAATLVKDSPAKGSFPPLNTKALATLFPKK